MSDNYKDLINGAVTKAFSEVDGRGASDGVDSKADPISFPLTDTYPELNYLKLNKSDVFIEEAAERAKIKKEQDAAANAATKLAQTNQETKDSGRFMDPFDVRINTLKFMEDGTSRLMKPHYYGDNQSDATNMISFDTLVKEKSKGDKSAFKGITDSQVTAAGYDSEVEQEAVEDTSLQGVPALFNSYAIIKLAGSEGGQHLINSRGNRKFYEVDSSIYAGSNGEGIALNYSQNPTTTNIISWAKADPYQRTTLKYADFVCCKHWNKIPNNRLMVLRRFTAPVVDNMNFAGMDGEYMDKDGNLVGGGADAKVSFPPLATVVTYFGEGTNNDISTILSFTTGLKWGATKADMWGVTVPTEPGLDNIDGQADPYKGVHSMSKWLNIANGNFNMRSKRFSGFPPDPYASDGKNANKIQGPVNVIDEVRKRDKGIEFKMDGIKLTFDYNARPVGGLNTKAVMLDIISNFLIIGSATATFYGGQHRFLHIPPKYPFIGGPKAMSAWYKGDAAGFAQATKETFTGGGKSMLGGLGGMFDSLKSALGSLLNMDFMGALKAIQSTPIGENTLNNAMGNATQPQQFMSNVRSLLIGEPVGEWHLTVGNPLNPIAVIGNLICASIDVKFGNELGPDDFPLDVTFTVNLEHGMARDRDALQAMFNRGMGRIYSLPYGFMGSGDKNTSVDKATDNKSGFGPGKVSPGVIKDSGGWTAPSIIENELAKQNGVWKSHKFTITDSSRPIDLANIANRVSYRDVSWVGRSGFSVGYDDKKDRAKSGGKDPDPPISTPKDAPAI